MFSKYDNFIAPDDLQQGWTNKLLFWRKKEVPLFLPDWKEFAVCSRAFMPSWEGFGKHSHGQSYPFLQEVIRNTEQLLINLSNLQFCVGSYVRKRYDLLAQDRQQVLYYREDIF